MLTVVAVPLGLAPTLLPREAWHAIDRARRVFADPPLLAGLPADLKVEPLSVEHPQLPNDAARLPAVWLVPAVSVEVARSAVAGMVLASDVASDTGSPRAAAAAAEERADTDVRQGGGDVVAVVSAPEVPGAALLDLVAVMDRLRSPGGCPWDAQQTHESLVPYLLEETYETLEAIETGDDAGLREELGDLLLQVVFHARVAHERPDGAWSVDDVARGITDKLVGRHPHVFADVDAPTAADVEANWEVLKAAEKQRTSVTDGVPLAQPALALAAKLHSRVRKAGLTVALPGRDPSGVTVTAATPTGATLLALAVAMQEAGVDPETELRAAARDYAVAIRAAEASR